MAIRNMLHISKLKAFEAFLESKGYMIIPTVGAYEYLKEFHTSEGKAVKARELCVLFNVHEKQLRNIVSDLRQNGEAICSSTYGYWYSRDPDDISTTLSRLVGQVDNMQKVIAGLNRILQEVQDEQKEN